jgi:LysM repeat protein
MKRLVSIVLACSLLLAVLAVPAGAQTCAAQYTVKAGDNLYRIGLAHGVPWPAIAAANNLSNPNVIFPGQVLCIPPASAATAGPSATAGTPAATATRTATAAPSATPARTNTPAPTGSPAPTATRPPSGTPFAVPTITIIGVVRNTSVTIRTANFPANQTFNVTMGALGTQGYGGYAAGTVSSGAGGVFTATVNIPAQMANAPQIAILLASAQGYYSYNWFWNNNYP